MKITVTAAEYRLLISALVLAEDHAYLRTLEYGNRTKSGDRFRTLRHKLLRSSPADRGGAEGER